MYDQLLLALTFFTSCNALPITPKTRSTSPSVPVCLAVLCLVLGLLLLLFAKRVYIHKTRRLNQARQNSILSLPISSTDSVPSHKEKAGFITGFFGSPTVEIQCALEKAEWKENKQSSFTYQIHIESRRRRVEYPSVLDISSRLRSRSVSTSPRTLDKKSVLRGSHSLNLPSLPEKAYLNKSSVPPHSRRFSLPNMNRNGHGSNRRRHSSLKSARSRRSVTFSPGSPFLRIIDSSPGRDTSLHLSPRLSEVSTTSPAPSSISASSPKTGPRLSRSFIPPLPPFPFMSSPPSSTQRAGVIQISYPYALSARKIVQAPQTDPRFPASVHQPAPTSSTNCIPLKRPLLGQAPLSPTLSSFPSPPTVTGILKPKLKVRTRRSPTIGAIGPSPLRSMILPESFESELSSYARTRFTQSVHSGSENAGIAQSASNGIFSKANRKHSTVSSPHASEVDDDDPSLLLEIIRELVEETSEWDPSTVFMNESFKTLLQESGITPTKSARDGFAEAQVANAEKKPDDDRSAGSENVDLELLGLDIFESESPYNARSSKADNAANLVSFWDEDSGERAECHPGAARLSEWRGDIWDPLFSFMSGFKHDSGT
ncbi:hypothetical protein DFH08DRAFT_982138 [Mycena albidolilacea]|uniref:Uncharacterized protein n=1 Tax=Mycena albidolilacea TaxID=1033008 RepID=A0AAD7F728_9AGAR|nr:hypothetical protein DFH08DRAFT_982138 [Mycena albidolilacea]